MAHSQALSVETYDRLEIAAQERLSNDHIRAFSPATFRLHGYPDRAETDQAILRYVDTMQEFAHPHRRFETDRYSAAEARIVKQVTSAAFTVTQRDLGRGIRPWMCPFATMDLFRTIQDYAGLGRQRLRIFEIGPGSGHLGAMLIASGHDYMGCDNAQGFYLWQNKFWAELAGPRFVELAFDARGGAEVAGRVTHLPWWQFCTLYREAFPTVDVIVADHMLGELNPYALRYLCDAASEMLPEEGIVLFDSIGEPRFSSDEAVRLNFERCGFKRLFSHSVQCFALTDEPRSAPARLAARLATDIPAFDPDGSGCTLTGREIVPIDWREAPMSYEFYSFIGFSTPGCYK